MDALTALQTRTSSPRLTEPGPSPQQLELMLQAALRAADHALLQPWRFILIQGESRIKLGELFAAVMLANNPQAAPAQLENAKSKALRAPAILTVVVCPTDHPKVPSLEQKLSAAAAAQNILLAAFAQGIGAVWRTGEAAYAEVVKRGLELDNDEEIIGFIYLGTPAAPARTLPEIDTAKFVRQW